MGVKRVRLISVAVCGALAVVLGVAVSRSFSEEEKKPAWVAPEADAKKANPVAADEASLSAGKAAFVKNCVMCHGTEGKGDGPAAGMFATQPRDLRAADIVAQSDGSMFWKITTGKKPMQSFEQVLTEKERWSVVNYVRTLAPAKAAATEKK